jgi:hypothetical protein
LIRFAGAKAFHFSLLARLKFACARRWNSWRRDPSLRRSDFNRIGVDGNEITAGVGVKLKEVAYAGKAAGLGGLEWMEGIPGAIGGGLRMNAGAMGAQTFENVLRVRYLDAEGNPHTKTRSELEVHYRNFPCLKTILPCPPSFAGNLRQLKKSFASWKRRKKNGAHRSQSQKAPAAFLKTRRIAQQENWLRNWA